MIFLILFLADQDTFRGIDSLVDLEPEEVLDLKGL